MNKNQCDARSEDKGGLYKTMMWLRNYFIDSLIWFLPHPHGGRSTITFTIHEEKSEEAQDESLILKNTLFWELLVRVREEATRQSDLLLNKEILKLKHQKRDEWNALMEYNVVTEHSDGARQDVQNEAKKSWMR
eukprot:838875_1